MAAGWKTDRSKPHATAQRNSQALVTAIDVLYEDVRHAIGCVAGVIDGCPGALGTGVRGIDR